MASLSGLQKTVKQTCLSSLLFLDARTLARTEYFLGFHGSSDYGSGSVWLELDSLKREILKNTFL